jgi:hypothetical protein
MLSRNLSISYPFSRNGSGSVISGPSGVISSTVVVPSISTPDFSPEIVYDMNL